MNPKENRKGKVQGCNYQVTHLVTVKSNKKREAQHGQVNCIVLLVDFIGVQDGANSDANLQKVEEIRDYMPFNTAQAKYQ